MKILTNKIIIKNIKKKKEKRKQTLTRFSDIKFISFAFVKALITFKFKMYFCNF